jgi:hypothetical protein
MSFYIKRNDTSPSISATLASDGTAVDLTGATVKFIMRLPGATSAKVNTAATVVSAADGTVRYDWVAANTDTAGLYQAEFEVTFAGGAKRTFPADDYLYVSVVTDLA